jgi:glycosyltransferase involved in cell wall biosynthesis
LRKSDIIAFPYRHIDSSGAFLSALHYGKAMVASRVGMFAGLDEQRRALICAPDDADALADALRASGVAMPIRARHWGRGRWPFARRKWASWDRCGGADAWPFTNRRLDKGAGKR